VQHFLLVVVDVPPRPENVAFVLLEFLDVLVELVPVTLHEDAEDQLHRPRGSVQQHCLQREEPLRLF
jgi:hypothetical protein